MSSGIPRILCLAAQIWWLFIEIIVFLWDVYIQMYTFGIFHFNIWLFCYIFVFFSLLVFCPFLVYHFELHWICLKGAIL